MQPETKPENPPAFPTKQEVCDPRSTGWTMIEGMTLRDYFAAKAMQALITRPQGLPEKEFLAGLSYEMADAMLKARQIN